MKDYTLDLVFIPSDFFFLFYSIAVVVLLIFLLFSVDKNAVIFGGVVVVYFLTGMYHNSDITAFHLYLTLGLVYMSYSSLKNPSQTSSNFLVCLVIAAFICFSNIWFTMFVLILLVVLVSFIFLDLSPYLNRYLDLEEVGIAKPRLPTLLDRLKSVAYSIYYDTKYLRLIRFWEETFPKRIAKATNRVFLEVITLVFLSLSTILHTRLKFLLPAFFFRCILTGHPMWMLWYFLPVGFLTLLVHYPLYVNFLKKAYGNEVFKEIGWNAGLGQVVTGLRTALTTTAGATALVVADDYVSTNFLNQSAVDKGWSNYYKDHKAWSEARSSHFNFENYPNEPTPPNCDEIRKRRLRITLLEAFNLKGKVGDIFSNFSKFPKK